MTTTSPTRRRGRTRSTSRGRLPELDAARGVALALVALVLLVPVDVDTPAWLGPSPWHGLRVADALPAILTCVAGAAMGLQLRAHRRRPVRWWWGRTARRVAVLVGVGLLLAWATGPAPSLPPDLTDVRLTGHLSRLAIGGALALPLLRRPRAVGVAVAVALVVAHGAWLLLAGDLSPQAAAPSGLDVGLLGPSRAVGPVDGSGLAALPPTVALLVAGAWLGDWVGARARGAATAGILALAALWGVVGLVVTSQVVPVNATLWTFPTLVAGVTATLLLVAGGHLLTRLEVTDGLVARLAVLGRAGLPTWVVLVLAARWLVPTRAWDAVVAVPATLVGRPTAGLLVAALATLLLRRLLEPVVDRGWDVRA